MFAALFTVWFICLHRRRNYSLSRFLWSPFSPVEYFDRITE